MTNLPTVTIGIPAYNEQKNIGQLLANLEKQEQPGFMIDKVIVASDASTDSTDTIVNNYAKAHGKLSVQLITNPKREGQGIRQNQIIENTTSDILVLINADIFFSDQKFIAHLIEPIISGADMTCGPLDATNPTTFMARILRFGAIYRRTVFGKYNDGNNLFTCHGSHRAFSKKFYVNFRFQSSVAEDAYSYLYCLKNGFNYQYAPDAAAFIQVPSSLAEHLSQCKRFFKANNRLAQYFDNDFIAANTKWPISLFVTEGFKLFVKYPLEAMLYCVVTLYTGIISKLSKANESDTWNMVLTSKTVRS